MKIKREKPAEICKDHYLLKIEAPGVKAFPGQFVNIKIGKGTDPLLRRPFSVHDQYEDLIEIVFRAAGKGTSILKETLTPGEVDIFGPAGKGFTPVENSRVLITGGGVGNAPLFYLAKLLKELNNRVVYIFGARSAEYIFLEDKYAAAADEFIITTDNGSRGAKGIITDFVSDTLKENHFDFIYSCGPDIMQKKLARLAADKNIPIEVSIEKYFGCGIGVCYGCAVETGHGIKRACVDGPVFNGSIIKWD